MMSLKLILLLECLIASGVHGNGNDMMWNKHSLAMEQLWEDQDLDKLATENVVEDESRNTFGPLLHQPIKKDKLIKAAAEFGSGSGSGQVYSAFGSGNGNSFAIGIQNDKRLQRDLELLKKAENIGRVPEERQMEQENYGGFLQEYDMKTLKLTDKEQSKQLLNSLPRHDQATPHFYKKEKVPKVVIKTKGNALPNRAMVEKKFELPRHVHPNARKRALFKKFLFIQMLQKLKRIESERKRE